MPLVSFPMYRVPARGLETFWRGLRRHLAHAGVPCVPEDLSRPDDLRAHWRAPDLLLSQTCGYPLTHDLTGAVRYVATPCYAAEGCAGPAYRSALVVRAGDAELPLSAFRGRTVAFNSRDSHSGMNALRAAVADLAHHGRFFGAAVETGAHRASVAAIRDGRADLAAVDAVTWALLLRDEPARADGLGVLGYTAAAPGLPYVTAGGASDAQVDALRAGLAAAMADPDLASARVALMLDDIKVLDADAYDAIVAVEADAVRRGYGTLA